jgi:aminopeptidase-like protein
MYVGVIKEFEIRRIFRNRMPNCEVMLSKYGLYPTSGGAQRPKCGDRSELDLILWLLFLCDGRRDIENISIFLDTPVKKLLPICHKLLTKGIFEIV